MNKILTAALLALCTHSASGSALEDFISSAKIVTLTPEESAEISAAMQKQHDQLRAMAEQGDSDAMNRLGNMYGTSAEGFYWIRKSAESGNLQAQHNLSLYYWEGWGTPRNLKLAYVWSSVAAAGGHEPAETSRDMLMSELSPSRLEEAEDLAVLFFEKYRSK